MHDNSRLRHGLAATVDVNDTAGAAMRGNTALEAAADLVIRGGVVVKSKHDDIGLMQENAQDAPLTIGEEGRALRQDRQAERRAEQLRGLRAHCLQMACDKAGFGVASSEIVRVAGEFYAFITKSEG